VSEAAIVPFTLAIEASRLDDLRRRLEFTRWPDAELVEDWSQGAPLSLVKSLIDYWRTQYDWRRCETRLNSLGQYLTHIDGVEIHFLHIRSTHRDALPLILTHGWPGSVIEFLKCVGPLVDPTAHGAPGSDAFHVVIPSLPGYGFSSKPREKGWTVKRIAKAWDVLMRRLGYDRYVAQGGDWGAVITTAMGIDRPEGLAAIHLNLPLVRPREPGTNLSAAEARMLEQLDLYARWESGYASQQSSRPQTLGYALADSPAGQAAWIYEKFHAWTDNSGVPESTLTQDEMLDNIMLYWLPNTGTSSARLYWESYRGAFMAAQLHLPTGCSIFPKDIYTAPRSWAEHCIHNLMYWNELDRGGHFAAFEQPALFVEELRRCFRSIR
jgi:pimeloyl-ACP methyl ester carboxylesterase